MKKNKMFIIGGIILALIVVGATGTGAYVMTHNNSDKVTESPKPEEKKKKRVDTYNTLAVEERPFIEVLPKSTGHDVVISINQLKKPAETVDYELEYQAGELLQGAFGSLDTTSLPAIKEILLGSRSAGGATTYHENVKGGTLVTRFAGSNTYSLKSDWRFIENKTREKATSSKDAKFQIESPDLAKQRLLIISNSPGYPDTLPGTAASDVYVLSFPDKVVGKAKISIRTAEEITDPQIAVWDGQSWKAVASTADGKTVSADVELAKAYLVIKK